MKDRMRAMRDEQDSLKVRAGRFGSLGMQPRCQHARGKRSHPRSRVHTPLDPLACRLP